MMYKYCLVPNCTNTSIKTPEKRFFSVPKNPSVREKWCFAINRTKTLSCKSTTMCCEDHFDIEEDTLNYIQYKIMLQENQKVTLRLKPGVIPHKFPCQVNGPEKRPPQRKKHPSKRLRPEAKDAKHKKPASERAKDGRPPVEGGAGAAPCAASHELEVKTEMLDEVMVASVQWPATRDPLGCSPKRAADHELDGTADELLDYHDEISLPDSPPDIKAEIESEEDSNIEHKVADYETIISNIKEEMAELKCENQRLADENRRLTDENRILTEKSQNLTSGIDQLLEKSEHQMTNYESLSTSTVVKKLEDEKKQLKEENERLKNAVLSLNSESKKQATSILRLTEKEQKHVEKTEQLNRRIQQLMETNKSIRLTDLKQKIQQLNKRNQELTEEIHSLEMKNKSIMEQVEAIPEGTPSRKELLQIRCLTEENRVLAERVTKLKKAKDGRKKRKRKLV